jgi:hypothetical protein
MKVIFFCSQNATRKFYVKRAVFREGRNVNVKEANFPRWAVAAGSAQAAPRGAVAPPRPPSTKNAPGRAWLHARAPRGVSAGGARRGKNGYARARASVPPPHAGACATHRPRAPRAPARGARAPRRPARRPSDRGAPPRVGAKRGGRAEGERREAAAEAAEVRITAGASS